MIPDNRKIPPQQLDVESTIDGRINENVAEPQPGQIELNAQGFYEIRTIYKELTGSVVSFTTSAIMGAIDAPVYDTFTISPTPTSAQWENKVKMLFSCAEVPSIISSPPAYLNITGTILTGYENLNLLEFVVDYKGDVNLTITQLADANEDPEPPVVGDPDFVGYWKFEETVDLDVVLDSSGNANHGNIITSGNSTRQAGKVGSGIACTSSSNLRFTISDNPSINLAGKSFSMGFWFKADQSILDITNIVGIANKGNAASQGFRINKQGSSSSHVFQFQLNGTSASRLTSNYGYTVPDVWVHLFFTFNGSDQLKCYVNGVLDTTSNITSTSIVDNTEEVLTIVGELNALRPGSELDELRMYTRLLSDAEVLAIYNEENA
jgi:hypothetical protein